MPAPVQLKAEPVKTSDQVITDSDQNREKAERNITALWDNYRSPDGNNWASDPGINKKINFKLNVQPRLLHDFNRISVNPSSSLTIQPKLAVNAPGDEYEQEADAVADKVMQMPGAAAQDINNAAGNALQNKPANGGEEQEKEKKEEEEQLEPVAQKIIQRKYATGGDDNDNDDDDERSGNKNSGKAAPLITPNVQQVLQSPGQPLDTETRSFMESRFGFDFSKVQIHNNSLANQSSKDINALAYTHQHHIAFRAGQYQPQTESGRKLLAHELMHVVQQGNENMIQRMAAVNFNLEEDITAVSDADKVVEDMSLEDENARSTEEAKFIVEDGTEPGKGQIRKSDFLEALNDAICRTVDRGLRGTEYSSDNCPYIRAAFAKHKNSTPLYIEQLIDRYSGVVGMAKNAHDLIRLMQVRVMSAVKTWLQTGDMSGVPADIQYEIYSSMGTAIKEKIKNAVSSKLSFKAKEGGAHATQSPHAVMQSLGKGNPLEGRTRGRMESAFGTDFGNVEIHTDSHAAKLASSMNARAFAVGNHIAFGGGEHKPGTLIGDALMAHELAHVEQQNNATVRADNNADYQTLEEDADETAIGVIVKVLTGKDINLKRKLSARLKTGLRLSSCKSKSAKEKEIERLSGLQSGFLEEKRKKLEAEKQMAADQAAKASGGPKVKIDVDINDTLKEEASKPLFKGGPADPWEKDISEADRQNYIKVRVPNAWAAIIASIKGTELEKVMKGITPDFQPKKALENGWYAWGQQNKTMGFGMSFIHDAEKDPKNSWPILAHEMGGHEEYGKTYSSEIMDEVISNLPKHQQDYWKGPGSQDFANRYNYPETEIYSALRQRRYSEPVSGTKPTYSAMAPELNIPDKLKRIKDSLHPDVARAVLVELKKRIDANPEILDRDKKYFLAQVKLEFGYDL